MLEEVDITSAISSKVRPPQRWAIINSRSTRGSCCMAVTAASASSRWAGSWTNQSGCVWPCLASCLPRLRSDRPALMAALRTTRKSQAAGLLGIGVAVESFRNASCTTSSGVPHHCRARSTSTPAWRSKHRPSSTGSMALAPADGCYR